jgi:hypothetical protein
MVVLSCQECLAAPNCLSQWHILTHSACPRFRHREGLGKEALHTARPGEIVAEAGVIFNPTTSFSSFFFSLALGVVVPVLS